MIKKLLAVSVLFLLILCPLSAGAIPALGVAPGLDADGNPTGTYNGILIPGDNDYLKFFASTFEYTGGDYSFVAPQSGGDLAIWWGNNSGDVDMGVDIWLVTDAWGATDGGFSFGGTDFTKMDDSGSPGDKASAYFYKNNGDLIPPYYGVNLGSIDDNWTEITNTTWSGNKKFYYIQAQIIYGAFEWAQEDWFFAIADFDDNGVFNNGIDDFSPRTTSSSNPVPEPATMLLFGSGLIGLAALGRKKFRKTNNS